MSELQDRLERLILRLDHMGMRAEQAVNDALRAARRGDVEAGRRVHEQDARIDREEVEIEQECIRLLALYQPAAIDLRTLCTVIKVNNDLERIADLAANIGKRVGELVDHEIRMEDYPLCQALISESQDVLGRTVRMIAAPDASAARTVIDQDRKVDDGYHRLVASVLDFEDRRVGGAGPALAMINLAKALERIGDLCTNIAEDLIFLRTGDIVRHSDAREGYET